MAVKKEERMRIDVQNRLIDVSKVTKLINRPDAILYDQRDGRIIDKDTEVKHFAIIFDLKENEYMKDAILPEKKRRKKKELSEDPEEAEKQLLDEQLKQELMMEDGSNLDIGTSDDGNDEIRLDDDRFQSLMAKELRIDPTKIMNLKHRGFFIVPIMAGMTEFRPVWWNDLKEANQYSLQLMDEPLFKLKESIFDENDPNWKHSSLVQINQALEGTEYEYRFCAKSIFHHTRNKHGILDLKTAVHTFINAKKTALKVENNIRSSLYTSLGHMVYHENKDVLAEEAGEDPKKFKIIKEIVKEYKALEEYVMEEKNPIGVISTKIIKYIKKESSPVPEKVSHYVEHLLKRFIKDSVIEDEEEFKLYKEKYDIRLIPSYITYCQIRVYIKYMQVAEDSEKVVKQLVQKHPLWKKYLVQFNFLNTTMAAYLLGYLNIDVAEHPSSFIRYCGMDQIIVRPEEGMTINDKHRIDALALLIKAYWDVVDHATLIRQETTEDNYNRFAPDALQTFKDYTVMDRLVKEYDFDAKLFYMGKMDKKIEDNLEKIMATYEYREIINRICRTIVIKRQVIDGVSTPIVHKRARNKNDVEINTYIDKHGWVRAKRGRGYNAELKGRLRGVWLQNNIKGGGGNKRPERIGYYVKMYYNYRSRLEQRPDIRARLESTEKGVRKPNLDSMASRYVIQRFLEDIWINWRIIEGLPLNGGTYEEGKLGRIHLQGRPQVLEKEYSTKESYKKENVPV